MEKIVELYRKHIPEKVRTVLYKFIIAPYIDITHRPLYSYYCFFLYYLLPKTEKTKAYAFIGRYGRTMYPGKYSLKYKKKNIVVHHNINLKLPYVIHNERKLYFPETYTDKEIISLYKSLITEQDELCPHRYVSDYSTLKDRILLDIGAAEGIFALDTINFTSQIYLFECEDSWIPALNETFKPWKEKVHIVKKYIGSANHDQYITLDSFLSDNKGQNLFIKMDIEGGELEALKGAQNLFSNNNVHFSICLYHNKEDQKEISSFLKKNGHSYIISDGFLFHAQELRRGVIRNT